MMRFLMVRTFPCLANEHGCQVSEDERLYERNQYLDEINEDGKSQ